MITPHGPEVAIRTQEKFQANLRNPWGRGQPAPRLSAIITSQLEAQGGKKVVTVDCTDRMTVGLWMNLRWSTINGSDAQSQARELLLKIFLTAFAQSGGTGSSPRWMVRARHPGAVQNSTRTEQEQLKAFNSATTHCKRRSTCH